MQTVLITGGSSGIGFELSKLFAADNYRLLWVALEASELESAERILLEHFPKTEIHHFAIDLSVDGASLEVFNWVKVNQWEPDVLINCAGFGIYGSFNENSLETALKMIRVNVSALFELTHYFYREMLDKNAGTIVNMSSGVSYLPMPNMAAYAATKAFVRQFSESLYMENKYRKSNVRILTVCPAAVTNTDFQKKAGMEKVRTFASGLANTSPQEVAKDTYRGIRSGKRTVRSGIKYRITYWLTKLSPPVLTNYLIKREMERSE